MLPKELDELIKTYLTDGVITSKERQVLLRKAEQMGLDVEEVDLYIDAQQQKMDQQADDAARQKRGKTCPFCSASVPMFADKCPECGGEITPEASKELEEIIDNLEEALIDFKSGVDFARSKAKAERYIRKASMYYSNNKKVKILLENIEDELAIAEAKHEKEKRNDAILKLIKNPWMWFLVLVLFQVLVFFVASWKWYEYWISGLNYITWILLIICIGMSVIKMVKKK